MMCKTNMQNDAHVCAYVYVSLPQVARQAQHEAQLQNAKEREGAAHSGLKKSNEIREQQWKLPEVAPKELTRAAKDLVSVARLKVEAGMPARFKTETGKTVKAKVDVGAKKVLKKKVVKRAAKAGYG